MSQRVEHRFGGRIRELRRARRTAIDAARGADLDEDASYDLQLAVDEAVANAIECGAGEVVVRYTIRAGRIDVRVTDDGPGLRGSVRRKMPDPESERGRGVPLICSVDPKATWSSGRSGGCVVTFRVAN